jgi:hypothetical protein
VENTGHFKYELLRLTWDRWARCLVTDRFISDFSSVWRHLPHDENGVTGSVPPKAWVDAWYKLEKQAQKADGVTNIGGNSFQFDSETGNLTIIGQSGSIQIMKGDLLKVLSFIMTGPPPEMDVQGVLPDTQGQNAFEFSAELKLRHDRNWEAMEEWAKASSKTYPKNT